MDRILYRLSSLYDGYLETVNRLESERKLGEGMFGLRPGPADNPCHDRFAEDLEYLLQELTPGETDSALLRTVMEYIYDAPVQNPDPKSAYWMLIAVQGLTKNLIAGLSQEDADALAAHYAEQYPRSQRMPIQNDLLKLLRQAGGGNAPEKRPFLFWKK